MPNPVQVVSESRYIEITSCSTCLHRDHNGAFGSVAYVPVCRASGGKTLPYDVYTVRGFTSASVKPGIPNWCPLPIKTNKPVECSKRYINIAKQAYIEGAVNFGGIGQAALVEEAAEQYAIKLQGNWHE